MKSEEKKSRMYRKIIWQTIITVLRSFPQLCKNAWNKNNPYLMQESKYSELTPNKTASKTEEYFNALDLAISNPNIKNIALTGPYGSGKSSVIYSYLSQRPTINPIIISLATFSETNPKKKERCNGEQKKVGNELEEKQIVSEIEDECNAEFTMDELEKGILKQLFYKVNYRKIPQSRYRKIHKIGRIRTTLSIFIFTINSAFVSWLLGYNFVVKFFDQACERIEGLGVKEIISKCFVTVFVVAMLFLISHILWMLTTRIRFGGIKIADKFELATQNIEKENAFNRNLDEIIYFFESTNYDVIFIEDLDRFKNNEIFIKLRELNMLINNYEMIKRKVVFVYAIRDDMFTNTDRTKFFDFIIPIIPYINSTNSGEILRSLLGLDGKSENGMIPKHKISEKMITLVAPYISDMRVLTCIMNEFWIYLETIKGGQKLSNLTDENMLALMVFKNMFPNEFAMLEGEKGIIKQAFEDKKTFVESQKKRLEDIVEQNVEILNKIEKDILSDISELKIAFLGYLVNFTGIATTIWADGVSYTISEIMKETFDFNLLNVKNVSVYNKTINAIPNQNLTNVFNEDPIVQNYFDRYRALLNGTEERKEELKKNVEDAKEKADRIMDHSLVMLMRQYSKEEIFSTRVAENDLLVFLLRRGYIDENYQNYINYFHPKSISTEEMNFILGVRNHRAVGDYNYTLEHCDKIIERLEIFEFEQKEILNYTLVDYILLNASRYSQKYKRLVKLLTNRSNHSKEFIESYIDRGKNIPKFISALCDASGYIWRDFETDAKMTNAKKEKFLLLILSLCNTDAIYKNEYIKKEPNKKSIKAWIEGDKDILLKCSNISTTKMKNIINTLDVVFEDINICNVDNQLLEFIYEERHYKLNKAMLENLFSIKAPEKIKDLSVSNYSTIRSLGYQPLLDVVFEEFDAYVRDFVLEEANTQESLDAINDVMERLSDKPEICTKIIEKQRNAYWESISDCLKNTKDKQAVWNHILVNGKIGKSWKNCAEYYNLYGPTKELCCFIDRYIQELVLSQRIKSLTDEMINELLCADISINAFEIIIDNYKVAFFTGDLSQIDQDKLQILISKRYIPYSTERYIELSNISSVLAADFAVLNREQFIKQLDECILDVSDINELIKRKGFSDQEKIAVLKLLEPNGMNRDIALQCREFDFILPREIVDCAWDVLEDEMKYELLYNQLTSFSLDEIAEKFKDLDKTYHQFGSRNKKKFVLPFSQYNKKLCAKLKKIGFLTSCNEENKKLVGYVKQK